MTGSNFISISEFCTSVGMSRPSFYNWLKEIEPLIVCEKKTTFKTISGKDIKKVREYFSSNKRLGNSEDNFDETKNYILRDAQYYMGISHVSFNKKILEEDFLKLFTNSEKIEKIVSISEESIDRVKRFLKSKSGLFKID